MRIYIFITCMMLTQSLWSQYSIIPQPQSMHVKSGVFTLDENVEIVSKEACVKEARMFVNWLNSATGAKFEVVPAETWQYSKPFILFSSEDAKSVGELKSNPGVNQKYLDLLEKSPGGAYTISMETRGVTVTGTDPKGVFYGVQTLMQMFPVNAYSSEMRLPYQFTCVTIKDQPKFAHRGLLLDCCRHFMSVDFIKKYIDHLAYYKMNVLHWHLTEDQGWRIEIEKYPRLTEVGAWRINADGKKYGGYYTKAQIRDIVQYATARHITIIPEIEMPGHSVAAIAAYHHLGCTKEHIPVEHEWGVFKDIYCAGSDSTFQFLEDVLTEVCELFPGTYIHIGGDEAPKYRWEHCDKCQARITSEGLENEAQLQTYFIERIAKFLETKGKRIIGWDEILEGGIPASAAVQSWRGVEGGMEAARHGHDVVMSPTSHCYFDYGLESIDTEKVYAFDPIPAELEASYRTYILGAECNMWTERAPQEEVDDRLFPRMPALAEVLWSYNPNRQYIEFERRLAVHYKIWDRMNIRYGFATVPLKFETRITEDRKIAVTAIKTPADLQLMKVEGKGEKQWEGTLTVGESQRIEVKALSPSGKAFKKSFVLNLAIHQALGLQAQLNYLPSKYYTGGGMQALTDGVLGSSNFRDGHWQAQTGQDLQAIIDFGNDISFTRAGSNFFHYANAWIFRPEELIIEYSSDGKAWKEWATIPATIDPAQSGELALDYFLTKPTPTTARFVRFTAVTIGPCPTWHDAVGEPSWVFWDEVVVE
jgi:hexosaminidase